MLAAGIAIGLPPLVLLLSSCRLWRFCLGALWTLLRLIPPPLTVLLLLLSNRPTLAIGALALGLHNAGVMGRLLQEGWISRTMAPVLLCAAAVHRHG